MQMTLRVIPVAIVDNDLCNPQGSSIFGIVDEGGIEVMMMKLVMVVAMRCFAASSASS